MDKARKDCWCCERVEPGPQACQEPARFKVIYGNSPDDMTLMCEGHVRQEWQPSWEALELTPEEISRYSYTWEEWVAQEAP